MNTEQTEQQVLQISRDKLLAFVRTIIGPRQGPEEGTQPTPPTPWDPVVREALERIGTRVALNPQPLPPRYAFMVAVAQTVISRAQLLQELAEAMPRQGAQNEGIDVGGYTSRLTDDLCGTGFRLRYPFPGPRPQWFASELDGIDLMVMATQFEDAAREAFNPHVRQNLAEVSAKLAEAGCSKVQSATGSSYARPASSLQTNAAPPTGYARPTSSVRINALPASGYASTPSSVRPDVVPASGYAGRAPSSRPNVLPVAGYASTAPGSRTNAVPARDGSHLE